MANLMLRATRGILWRLGLDLVRHADPRTTPLPKDIDPQAAFIIHEARPYSMTSAERMFGLIQAVRYVCATAIPGAIVECGVWRGGSMLAAARALLERGDRTRELYLYDTYEGMSGPTERDVDLEGRSAQTLLRNAERNDLGSAWCYATLEDARSTLAGSGYDLARVHFVKGRIEDTIPGTAPDRIAVLRLDTDWYESTRHELEQLYPRLSPGGVLIIDDYGHWTGCRQAVDEYFAAKGIHLLLNRVDYTGRIGVKPA